ncbi:efflux transporter outer membrane subunit [Sphingomonas sp. SUN019]|uniref:efflux transporter outer membrane subunit n=1 Tax=Sphingomonas sp. SUN019 TaxID=2937788 RepID=UPI002164210B|nr:efflux transporter outer membrane subunit [Sphingomonas sp. SUN019]UVO52041.1 efflux transporter outer membrane subunit [Sphingomonas sp. SUN019]
MMRRLALLLTTAALSGCSLAPKYVRPELPVPPSWPVGDAYLRQSEAALPAVTYRDIFRDPRLQQIIDQALANNRDLRVSVANITAARAQYRIQRSELFPQVDASGNYTYRDSGSGSTGTGGTGTGTGTGSVTNFSGSGSNFSASVGVTGFEIDLFGRVRSLSSAALNRYFSTEAAARATRLTLVGDIATAWLTYAADRSLLKVAEDTANSARASVRLTNLRLQGGVAPRTDLRQAEQILATAESDLASQKTALAQDVNALQLLVGAPVDPALLATSIEEAAKTVAELPAGLNSGVLLRRPDVVQAEYELRATNAEIGAARAQLFPRILLTGLLSFASNALSSLFTGGAFSYSGGGGISYPIFQAGAARANVALTQAQRDAALATYEKAIQTAFQEVSDALARRGTITDQLAANQRFAVAAADTYRLTDMRYRGGIDTFLTSLDAQRQLYSAQQQLVSIQLIRATNLVTLYRTLGGDSSLEPTANGPVPVAQQTLPPR